MKIVYMHHAERERNAHAAWGTPERTFDEITDLGKRQTELLAERLKNEKITAIITSPYTRCRHTAEIINQYHHLCNQWSQYFCFHLLYLPYCSVE